MGKVLLLEITQMNINSAVLSLMLLVNVCAFAQHPEPVVAKAFYTSSYQSDTTRPASRITEKFVLLLGKHSSEFTSYTRILNDSLLKSQYAKTHIVMPTGNATGSPLSFFHYFNEKKFFVSAVLPANFYYEDVISRINWKLLDIYKEIAGFRCQKATGEWAGRKYNVWFCTKLPFEAGPWKLHGLPGLILSATDSRGYISFEFAGFTKLENSGQLITWSSKAKKITKQEYKKNLKAAIDNPKQYIESTYGVKVTVGKIPPKRKTAKKTVNYPLEIEPD